ncbi:Alpha/Beta hydrolase protein [Protomyces lactucae-debilis]|uniref:Alpha/Beta hydrolase protein n=1 Tax=Protomyces lactucae-debilis TaxID=2754530 RepID=A0A1Y2FI31_PROLT|nr:Alpha/Beta hydrolase protein [Protomyces lactucae-debilis]ORY83034.1 Alpha/Beta hydrolase protein [Protomyces lactucae-debilis]
MFGYFGAETEVETYFGDSTSQQAKQLGALPSLHEKIPLSYWLSNTHTSTFYSSLANFEQVYPVFYRRYTYWHKEDGGNNVLDIAIRRDRALELNDYIQSGDKSLPPRTVLMTDEETAQVGANDAGTLVVLLHGLSGGSHESYVRSTIEAIYNTYPDEDSHVDCVVFNARGCARSKVTSKRYWSAWAIDDLAACMDFLRSKFPNRKIVICGYSIGANILCNYLGRMPERAHKTVDVAISVSNPWQLKKAGDLLDSYALGRLYSRAMTGGLQKLFKRHQEWLLQHPGIDATKVLAARRLHDFDENMTCRLFGNKSADEYYDLASSDQHVGAVTVPLLVLSAADDPLMGKSTLPFKQMQGNPNVVMAVTGRGGHLGWYAPAGEERWMNKVIIETVGLYTEKQ